MNHRVRDQDGRCAIRRQQDQASAVLAGAIAVALASTSLSAGPVIAPGWGYPVFQDNFDGGAVDPGVWEVANWAGANNGESQYYHPNQVSTWGGALHLRADRDPSWTYGREYNSGLVRTWQEWSYGRVEVRAKLPHGQGFWPAIWMLPRTAPWPSGGEIDIMEARGDLPWGVSSALHWGWDVNSHQHAAQWYESGANFQAGYHDYAVEWEIGTVRFYVDGVQHFTLFEPAVGIPGTAKSIVLNLAVGGNFSGYPDGTTPFPAALDIDYVRVWQRPDWVEPPTSLIRDPGFEDGDGAMAEWGRFGNEIDNVTSDWGTPLDGARSLKMFGQFNGQENYSGAIQNHAISGGERLTAGAHALTRSEDSIAGTANVAFLKIEFYSQAGAVYGSPFFLGETSVVIADAASPEDTWSYSELTAVAPGDAVEARVTLLFRQPAPNPGGAVFVDSVTLVSTPVACNDADLAEPLGVLDLVDVTTFSSGFIAQNQVADLNGDGLFDLSDVAQFIDAFLAGCP